MSDSIHYRRSRQTKVDDEAKAEAQKVLQNRFSFAAALLSVGGRRQGQF